MKKLLASAMSFAIVGCASPPQAPQVSPYGRQPINTAPAIQEYQARSSELYMLRNDNDRLNRELDAVRQQVTELKTYIIESRMSEAEAAKPASVQIRQSEPIRVRSSHPKAAATPGEMENKEASNSTIEINGESVVFRVYHTYGNSEFKPTPEVVEPMLRAAREGSHVTIRGRTDSYYASDANQRIAVSRAVEAKRFLVAQGISPSKIRIFFLSAGGFIDDNATTDGRAHNRRVEVQADGVNTASYRA